MSPNIPSDSDEDGAGTITVSDGESEVTLDPTAYGTFATFQSTLYSELNGWASQMQEVKLKLIWLLANDRDIPEYMQPLLSENAGIGGE